MDGLNFLAYVVAFGLLTAALGYLLFYGFFIVYALLVAFWPYCLITAFVVFAYVYSRDKVDSRT
jgi:membrane protein implicated in regulation of membrane protease activity